jgi:hypothetical protein
MAVSPWSSESGSEVDVETVTSLEMTVPFAVEGATSTVRVNTELPGGRLAIEQETVPPSPTVRLLHDQAPGEESETKVVSAGSVSERLAAAALLGPALVTVMV